MLIDRISPAVIAEKSTLRERLAAAAAAMGLTNNQVGAVLAIVPERLVGAGCFLDKMTDLWRYEFGAPYEIGKDLVWGTHIWVPVDCLLSALLCAYSRLPEEKRTGYLRRLADPDNHHTALVEMIPGHKVNPRIAAEFEVAGLGVGNTTVDWVIRPQGSRPVILDVKRRVTDFIRQAERMGEEAAAPRPEHDPALLFRSVEQKFQSVDRDGQLQGVWIFTDIKQDEEKLHQAFQALDPTKVHFAVFGDWKPDVYLLVQREADRQYLYDLFNVHESARFTFKTAEEESGRV